MLPIPFPALQIWYDPHKIQNGCQIQKIKFFAELPYVPPTKTSLSESSENSSDSQILLRSILIVIVLITLTFTRIIKFIVFVNNIPFRNVSTSHNYVLSIFNKGWGFLQIYREKYTSVDKKVNHKVVQNLFLYYKTENDGSIYNQRTEKK